MMFVTEMLPIIGYLGAGGIGAIALLMLAIQSGSKTIAIAAVAVLGLTLTMAWGVHKEKEVCEARFRAAEQNFEDLQNRVANMVSEFAVRSKVEIGEQEQKNADQLRQIMEEIANRADARCVADDVDVSWDRKLRRGTGTPPSTGKREGKTSGYDPERLREAPATDIRRAA